MRTKWNMVLIAAVAASMMAMTACGTKPDSGAGQQAAGAVGGAAQGGTAAGSTGQSGAAQGGAAAGSTGQGGAAQGGTPAGNASGAAKTTAVNAESIVKQSCIACHGDTLDGKGSPKKDLTKIGSKLTKEQIVNQINNGGGGMPALKDKLKPEEVEAVAEWLAAKK